jgi:hypothetical protein
VRFDRQTFKAQTVHLDSNEFVGCLFERCLIVYAASGPVSLNGNTFASCKWKFEGAAADTLEFLKKFHQTEGKELVERTLHHLFQATFPEQQGSEKGSTLH